jgi:hypothetical protein
LHQLQKEISKSNPDKEVVLQMTNEYYTFVPHSSFIAQSGEQKAAFAEFEPLPLIDTQEILQHELHRMERALTEFEQ